MTDIPTTSPESSPADFSCPGSDLAGAIPSDAQVPGHPDRVIMTSPHFIAIQNGYF